MKTNSEKIGYKPRGRKPGKRTDFMNDPGVIARREKALLRQPAAE
uniref:Putative transposase n=1 Tax=Rhizobium rhizogenes TaxID=359 RepID=A0A7S4ZRZ9_RHIRH|nr:putative transposase [Rhizobium rhizogenes]QCL09822.1 putative transposase [Rhizobium rhizogenes]